MNTNLEQLLDCLQISLDEAEQIAETAGVDLQDVADDEAKNNKIPEEWNREYSAAYKKFIDLWQLDESKWTS
jgi:hypothetical protein